MTGELISGYDSTVLFKRQNKQWTTAMFEKRFRITLLFNANKVYDRQVIEGVGEYLQASQADWDIFIEEDFRCRIDNIKEWLGDGVIADYDDKHIEHLLNNVDVPIVGVGAPIIAKRIIPQCITSPLIILLWSKVPFCT